MKFVWDYIKSRLPLLLLAFCLITCAVASMVYGKYVNNNKSEADINVTAQGVLTIPVTGGETEQAGTYVYTITNKPVSEDAEGSNIPAYIRAAIVVNWQDAEGNLWASPPVKNKDYVISSDCAMIGGYYYYNGECAPGSSFPITVTLTANATPPAGCTLHVKILAEGIQCMPADAVENAWGMKYEGDTWVKVTPQS